MNNQVRELQNKLNKLKNDKTLSDQQKQAEIDKLNAKIADLEKQIEKLKKEKEDLNKQIEQLNKRIEELNTKVNTCSASDSEKAKELEKVKGELKQAKQQLEQLEQDKTKSDEEKQKEIDKLNSKIAELEKKVQTCSAQTVGGAIVAPLVNEKPSFDIEKYKREHPDEFTNSGSSHRIGQMNPDTFRQQVHAALQKLAPMDASTDAPVQATAKRTDESERAQAEQKADTPSKQEVNKAEFNQKKFPQTGDNSLLILLSTFAGAVMLALGCFARKKQYHNKK